jgi:hypothetical protein
MAARPAAGGGRWVDVAPDRLPGWIDRFTARHGLDMAWGVLVAEADGTVRLVGLDGCTAELSTPPGAGPALDLDDLVTIAQSPRRVGLLLARRASAAVGIAVGDRLVSSKVDTSYVHSRTAAGGWSQQRYARRRENQAKAAAGAASDIVARILLPQVESLTVVVTGGDRRAVEAILADARLDAVSALRSERFLDVPEPRLSVLENAVPAARAVHILVRDPS